MRRPRDLVVDGGVALTHGPAENGRRSAAVARGPAVTGMLLSGALDDGVAGLVAIAASGGYVMVQDLEEALYPQMPKAALRQLRADHVLDAGRDATQGSPAERFRCSAEEAATDVLRRSLTTSLAGEPDMP